MFTKDHAETASKTIGIDWSKVSYTIDDLVAGMNVEAEHGKKFPDLNVTDDDPIKTAKIALAHLRELPDYYHKLKKYVEVNESDNPIIGFLQGVE